MVKRSLKRNKKQKIQRRIKTNRKRRSNRNNDRMRSNKRRSNRRSNKQIKRKNDKRRSNDRIFKKALNEEIMTKEESIEFIFHNKVSQDTVNKIYPLFAAVVKTFNKNKLDYWATGGTLLGAVRSKGMIQWDDDIDVAIKKSDISLLESLKEQFAEQDLRLYKPSGKYYKVKYADIKNNHLWIDIFIVDNNGNYLQGHKAKRQYLPGEIFPLKRGKYGPISIKIPNQSKKYLDRIFPNWRKTAIIYNHADKKKNKRIMKLTKDMLKPLLPKNLS